MRSISRVLATACLGLATLGLAGCGQDNEDFIKAQAAANAGKEDGSANKGAVPQNQADYAARQQKQMQTQAKDLKGAGYPAPTK